MVSGWAHHIEPTKGTRRTNYHTHIPQCQFNRPLEFDYSLVIKAVSNGI